MKGMNNMSNKRHKIIVGLASVALFAGFTTYTDYYDTRNNSAVISTETANLQNSSALNFTAPQNLALSQLYPAPIFETPSLQQQVYQSQAAATTDSPPEQPIQQPEALPVPNLPPAATAKQPASTPSTQQSIPPQTNPPVQAETPAAPAPVKQKTTTTRAS